MGRRQVKVTRTFWVNTTYACGSVDVLRDTMVVIGGAAIYLAKYRGATLQWMVDDLERRGLLIEVRELDDG